MSGLVLLVIVIGLALAVLNQFAKPKKVNRQDSRYYYNGWRFWDFFFRER